MSAFFTRQSARYNAFSGRPSLPSSKSSGTAGTPLFLQRAVQRQPEASPQPTAVPPTAVAAEMSEGDKADLEIAKARFEKGGQAWLKDILTGRTSVRAKITPDDEENKHALADYFLCQSSAYFRNQPASICLLSVVTRNLPIYWAFKKDLIDQAYDQAFAEVLTEVESGAIKGSIPVLPIWSAAYGTSSAGLYREITKLKASIGTGDPAVKDGTRLLEFKAASAWGGAGRKRATEITGAQLKTIYPDFAKSAKPKVVEQMVTLVNEAFTIMKIDTIEAQAAYLAHAAAESGQLTKLTNVAGRHGDSPSVKKFRGRGPLQVTLRENYMKTLAYLERAADDLAGQANDDPKLLAQVETMRKAVAAVKADPASAADPQYAFLFSAAFMHASRGVESSSRIKDPQFSGASAEDWWETGQAQSFENERTEKRAALVTAKAELAAKKGGKEEAAAKAKVARLEHRIEKLGLDISNAAKKKAAFDRANEELSRLVP